MNPTRSATILPLLALVFATGCAGYAGSVQQMRTALQAGDKPGALKEVDGALEVDDADEMPEKLSGDNALLVLERATIKQGLGRHESSALDFRQADKHLELLDLKNDTAGNIGKYLFSDDTTVYKAPAYEKLLLNTLNMLNYLALGDLESARVEARRLSVVSSYLANEETSQGALLGLGSYLSGFAFEMSGKAEQALQHYDDALRSGNYPSLGAPIRRLAACTSYRTTSLEPAIGELPADAACELRPANTATVLVVSSVGLAPHKEARRIPIGAAIVIAGAYMGALESARAQEFAAKGLLTFVNFPEMKKSRQRFSRVHVAVDEQPLPTELGVDVTEKVMAAWDSMKGKLMVAAITRMLTRLVAAEATQRTTKELSNNPILGLIAGLAVQGTLTAADTPDTRSWVTLPSAVFLSRHTVAPGRKQITIRFEGSAGTTVIKKVVDLPPGGFVVLPVATMR